MKPDYNFLNSKFQEFNETIFANSLPPIALKLSKARRYVGQFCYKKRSQLFDKPIFCDIAIRISTCFDFTESELEDTLIHEMIHYYIFINNLSDTSAHGKVFRKMMKEINENYGRNITISHRSTDKQREQIFSAAPRWHVVALVRFADGKVGIKVLPRIKQRIVSYHDAVIMADGVDSIELYLANDVFFNRFPNSSALKVHYIDEHLVMGKIEHTNRLDINTLRV